MSCHYHWILSIIVSLVVIMNIPVSFGYYFPGVKIVAFKNKQNLTVWANKLESPTMVFPLKYSNFNFCKGKQLTHHQENIGQILFGSEITSTEYNISMGVNTTCQTICTTSNKVEDILQFLHAIDNQYRVYWIVDNMPLSALGSGSPSTFGFPVGERIKGKYYINNHITLQISYHSKDNKPQDMNVIKVQVKANSRKYDEKSPCTSEKKDWKMMSISKGQAVPITYTFDYFFVPTNVAWSSRWDVYLDGRENNKVHWLSIINSLVIVFFLSGMVGMIIVRTLHKDIARYNLPDQEESQEEFGWKLVHGDVFRPPPRGMLLSVFLGAGVQVGFMAVATILFAAFGFLSPANRGWLLTSMIAFYVCMGTPAGFVSARIYKMLGGERWKTNVILTAMLIPSFAFSVFLILNIVLAIYKPSSQVPFVTLVLMLSLWIFISVPLCFLGAYMGFKRPAIEHPVRTNQIPRQIPEQVFYMKMLPAVLMGGILPFSAIFIELFFILSSLWASFMYSFFLFLMLIFFILILMCSEVSILMCYFHLCSEEYRWYWRSFLTSGSTALYFIIYSIFYYFGSMHMTGFVNGFLFFGYTILMALPFFLFTGTIGFLATFVFVSKIYGSIKSNVALTAYK